MIGTGQVDLNTAKSPYKFPFKQTLYFRAELLVGFSENYSPPFSSERFELFRSALSMNTVTVGGTCTPRNFTAILIRTFLAFFHFVVFLLFRICSNFSVSFS